MSIPDALDQAAKEANLSDTQIAASIGVSAGTVTHWRKAQKSPRSEHFLKLIEVVPGFGKLVGLEVAA